MIKASRRNNFHYNKRLKPLAQKLRNNSTFSEVILWKSVLKNKNMMGYQFLRQRPVLNYIADFMCLNLMLIIELEGGIHNVESVFRKDLVRKKNLEAVGFIILYFPNEAVLTEIELVRLTIENWIRTYENN